MSKIKTVEEYFAYQEEYKLPHLQKMKEVLQSIAPKAEQCLRYGVPALKEGDAYICYATHKKHIGLYADIDLMKMFSNELSEYKIINGTIHFPYDEKLPTGLIKKIAKQTFK